MPRRYAIPAAVMILYAALMILAGYVAYSAAPEGANATTALIIPGAAGFLMIVCGIMTALAGRNQRIGRIGAHAGLILTIIFALVFGYTAQKRTVALRNYPAAAAEYRQARDAGAVADTPEAQREFFQDRGAPRHDTTYLVRTLWFLTVLSGVTFAVLVVLRPRPRPEAEPPAATGAM